MNTPKNMNDRLSKKFSSEMLKKWKGWLDAMDNLHWVILCYMPGQEVHTIHMNGMDTSVYGGGHETLRGYCREIVLSGHMSKVFCQVLSPLSPDLLVADVDVIQNRLSLHHNPQACQQDVTIGTDRRKTTHKKWVGATRSNVGPVITKLSIENIWSSSRVLIVGKTTQLTMHTVALSLKTDGCLQSSCPGCLGA